MNYAIGKFRSCPMVGSRVELWIEGGWRSWVLANADDIPDNALDYGLFEYHPDDQFCYWIDPEKIVSINM